jgi:CheY-like chemotaxis protein
VLCRRCWGGWSRKEGLHVIEPMAPHKTVLVVEDDAALRGLLSLVIEARDYRVEAARDGQEALNKVQERRPDAIVLDLRLPTMNGDEVMQRLRADARFADIPIILVSAVGGHEAASAGHVRAFLPKPFEVEPLLSALERALA